MDVRTNGRGSPQELKGLPLSELVRMLLDDIRTLLRKEVELAKAETAQKAQRLAMGGGMLAGAALAGVMALAALTACIIAALALVLPVWAAALIVTGVWILVAATLALVGKQQIARATPPGPEQTVETLKEDVRWAKIRLRSGRR
jgi:predicted lipid-binding transport protein (Tim44 family)